MEFTRHQLTHIEAKHCEPKSDDSFTWSVKNEILEAIGSQSCSLNAGETFISCAFLYHYLDRSCRHALYMSNSRYKFKFLKN